SPGGEFPADLLADLRSLPRQRPVFLRIHDHVIDLPRGGFECHGLLQRLRFHLSLPRRPIYPNRALLTLVRAAARCLLAWPPLGTRPPRVGRGEPTSGRRGFSTGPVAADCA